MLTQILTPNILASGSLGGSNSSATTASFTVQPGQLIDLTIFNKGPNTTSANLPTLSGISVTWVQKTTFQSSFSSGEWRITKWVGVVTSVQSGTLGIAFAGQNQQAIAWVVAQFPNNVQVDFVNPQNAIIQTPTSQNNGTATSQSLSYSAFANINNATYNVYANDGQAGFSSVQGSDTVLVNINQGYCNFLVTFNPANETGPSGVMTGNNSTGKVAMGAEVAFKANFGGYVL
jgi:hypothetical protein